MAKPRAKLRCSSCQQFYKDRCQLGIPECRGANSVAADQCACYLAAAGVPAFICTDENNNLILSP